MADGEFSLDIIVGGDGENLIKRFLEEKLKYTNVELNNSKNYRTLKGYDISAINKNGKQILFEVKNDIKSARTGNIAIEFEYKQMPSGINSTNSNFWVSIGTNEIYIIKVVKLKEMINNQLYFRVVNGGDGNLAKMYLFKKNIIKDNSLVIRY